MESGAKLGGRRVCGRVRGRDRREGHVKGEEAKKEEEEDGEGD